MKTNILIVDDDLPTLDGLKAILQHPDWNVVAVRSGPEALRYLMGEEVAVILLDVNMPGMDGWEAATLVRRRPKSEHTPIIFVTASSQTEMDRLRGYELGAVDYVFAPVIPSILRAKVAVFVDLHNTQEAIKHQAEELASLNLRLAEQLQEVSRLNHQLEAANKELDAFGHSVAHDLRAPLRAIEGFSAALQEDCWEQLPEAGRSHLRRIRDNATRMSGLIDALLTLSRLTRKEMSFEEVDLTAAARAAAGAHAPHNGALAQHVSIQEGMIAQGDAVLLRIVMDNLIGNAFKYSGKQAESRIEVGSRKTDLGQTIYYVRDNGVGFDPQYAGRLFQPFQRLHTSDQFPGIGIGLTTVDRIIKRHGGRVWAESEPGRGATFYFTIG